jgi:multiple antibiotic resistance protein
MGTFGTYILDFLILFVMVNAFGNLLVFAGLTSSYRRRKREETHRRAVLGAALITIVTAIAGDLLIFEWLSAPVGLVTIAAGLIVVVLGGRGLIMGPLDFWKHYDDMRISFFPLAFPYLAGPATILYAILMMHDMGFIRTLFVIFPVFISVLIVVIKGPAIQEYVGKVWMLIITRVLYLLMCLIAIIYIRYGIQIEFGF